MLIFIAAFPFLVYYYPQIIDHLRYPTIAVSLAIFPAFFSFIYAPFLAHNLVRLYNFYHKKTNHKFRIYSGRTKTSPSRWHISLLTSLYPLGIIFKFTDVPITMNEIDLDFISLILIAQFLAIIISYSVFVISKSKLMIEFYEDGSKFNIGNKIREKINYGVLGSYFIIFLSSYEAMSFDNILFFGTLAVSAAMCFGSNLIGFYMLDRAKLIPQSIISLKRSIRSKPL